MGYHFSTNLFFYLFLYFHKKIKQFPSSNIFAKNIYFFLFYKFTLASSRPWIARVSPRRSRYRRQEKSDLRRYYRNDVRPDPPGRSPGDPPKLPLSFVTDKVISPTMFICFVPGGGRGGCWGERRGRGGRTRAVQIKFRGGFVFPPRLCR